MKKFLIVALVGLFAMTLSSWTTTNAGAQHFSYNFVQPYNTSFEDPCTGEMVVWSGNVHYHGTMTITPSGKYHFSDHGNLQGVSGVGQVTGTTYNFTGTFNDTWNTRSAGEHTYVTTQNIVSQGSGANYKFTVRHHHTSNANGDVSVSFDIVSSECN